MKEIYMDFSPVSVRCALMDNGSLVEVLIDSYGNSSQVGNMYAGRIENIIKSQFAFLNIGMEKNGFLQIDDFKQRGISKSKITPGAQLLVQVLKDQTDEKGAYLSCELSFTGRYVILNKGLSVGGSVGISQKIGKEADRNRLKEIAENNIPKDFGIIMRTESCDIAEEILVEEIKNLSQKAVEVLEKGQYAKAPSLIYSEDYFYAKSLKALCGDGVHKIIMNSQKELENVKSIAREHGIAADDVSLYQGTIDIFDEFGIESQIEKALHEKIWLKSGGSLIIEQTKTCAFIDVNTGKFTGKKSLEQTVLKNNTEAAQEIARQIRLRNLSGIIIVDFVNMKDQEERNKLIQLFQKELKKDRIVANIVNYGVLNMVQLTRKKMRPPLLEQMTDSCMACSGTGRVLNIENMIDRIYKKTNRILAQTVFNKITVESNKRITAALKKNEGFQHLSQKYNAEIEFIQIETGRLDYFEITKEKKSI